MSDTHEKLPRYISTINKLGGIANQLGIPQKPFTKEYIITTARKKTGHKDLGDLHFLTPLQKLIESYQHETDLTFIGREIALQSLIHLVSNRIQIQHDLKKYPEIKQQVIRKPLFIIGLPRSGTSLLYNLLALDKNARSLMFWESMFPSRPSGVADPRINLAEKKVKQLNRAIPDLSSIHEFNARKPDECLGLLLNTFVTPFFRGRVSAYRKWLYNINSDVLFAAYREYHTQLKLIQWQHHSTNSTNSTEHWVLKSPSHLFGLDALLKEFPDAGIVQTHRDPCKMIPSLCSLTTSLDKLSYKTVNTHEIGQKTVKIFHQLISRSYEARQTVHPSRFVDLKYSDLLTNPISMVEKIYHHFGYDMSHDLQQSITHYLKTHQQNKFGQHNYSLEDFGLTKEQLKEEFSTYYRHFQIEDET